MPPGGLHAAQFLLVDPLLDRGIADSQGVRGIAWVKEFLRAHGHLQKIALYMIRHKKSIWFNTIVV
jgi:hypothetical protein